MTGKIEVLEEVVFADEEPKEEPLRTQPPREVTSHKIAPASQQSESYAADYKPTAGKPRIYEVIVETVHYNKTGTKIGYSHRIKYPGWSEFFSDEVQDV